MKLVRTAILTTLTALLLSLSLSTPSWAQWGFPPQQPAASEQDVQDVQHQLDLLKKDFERLQSQTDRDLSAHKERISDLHAKASMFGVLVGFLTILIAIGVGFSFISATRSAVEKARDWLMDDAKKETEQLSADLVKESRAELEKHIVELEAELKSKIDEDVRVAKDQFDTMMADTENKHQEVQDMLARAQEAMQKGDGSKISITDKDTLRKAAQDADAKPESERTHSDWELRAVEAYLEGDFQASVDAYDHVVQSADATQEQVAKALFNKGLALRKYGDTAGALAAYDAVVERFYGSQNTVLRELVVKSMYNKGVALHKDGRTVDTLSAYDAVVERFGGSKEPGLRQWVAKALGNRGFERLIQSKDVGQIQDDAEQARVLLMEALADVEEALEDQPDEPTRLGNKAYALFLLGREVEAVAPMRRALELGGEKAFKTELEDASIHSLPQDKAFVALVKRLWAEIQAAQSDA